MKKGKRKKYRPVRIEPREDFDKAIVHQYKNGTLVYSYDMLVAVMMEGGCDSYEEAVEYIEYNILGSKSPMCHFIVRD